MQDGIIRLENVGLNGRYRYFYRNSAGLFSFDRNDGKELNQAARGVAIVGEGL